MRKLLTICITFQSAMLFSQNVGIGTMSPTADLEIVGDNNSAAIFWDDGRASLRHHFNALTWERSIFNMFLDANNDQNDAAFSIFTNSFTDVGLPKLKFDLEQGDSWIQTKKLAINHTSPASTLDVNGAVKIGTEDLSAPVAGTIRFENGRFEGFDGSRWLSLSTGPSWGKNVGKANESYIYNDTSYMNGEFTTEIELNGDFCFAKIEGANQVRVLKKSGIEWDSVQTLTSTFNDFGIRMASDGNDLIVACESSSNNPDTLVYFQYDGSSWIKQQEIPLPDEIPDLSLGGRFFEISGDQLIVNYGDGTELSFYTNQNGMWVIDSVVMADQGLFTNYSILSDDRAAVSYAKFNGPGQLDFSVLLFEYSNGHWQVSDTIKNPDLNSSDATFGKSMAMNDNAFIIQTQSGDPPYIIYSIHLFELENGDWKYRNTINNNNIELLKDPVLFGEDIEIQGNTVVISSGVFDGLEPIFYILEIQNNKLELYQRLTTTNDVGSPSDWGGRVEISGTTIATINTYREYPGVYFYERN